MLQRPVQDWYQIFSEGKLARPARRDVRLRVGHHAHVLRVIRVGEVPLARCGAWTKSVLKKIEWSLYNIKSVILTLYGV